MGITTGKDGNAVDDIIRHGEGVPLEIDNFASWVKYYKPSATLGITDGKKGNPQ